MKIYILLSAISFFLLAIVWSKKTPLNFFTKVFLFLMSFAGFLYYLQICGYIISIKN